LIIDAMIQMNAD